MFTSGRQPPRARQGRLVEPFVRFLGLIIALLRGPNAVAVRLRFLRVGLHRQRQRPTLAQQVVPAHAS